MVLYFTSPVVFSGRHCNYMARVRDKISMFPDHLLFLKTAVSDTLEKSERINSLKLYSIKNLYWLLEPSSGQQKSIMGLKKAADGFTITIWRLPGKTSRTFDAQKSHKEAITYKDKTVLYIRFCVYFRPNY